MDLHHKKQQKLDEISQYEKDSQGIVRIILRNKKTGKVINFFANNETPNSRSLRRLKGKIKTIKNKNPYNMFTFTFDEPSLAGLHTFRGLMRKTINKIKLYMSRNSDIRQVIRSKFDYVWRFELGKKTNRPHFHMICSTFIDIEIAKMAWGMGNVDVRPKKGKIKGRKMALNYLTKYITKDLKKEKKGHHRRFGVSKGWNSPYISDWEFLDLDYDVPLLDESEMQYWEEYVMPHYSDF